MNKRQEQTRERLLAYLHTHANDELNADSFPSLWHAIQSHLQTKRDEIYEDIKYYPPPIPACDQQFNFLLEQRAKIAQELSEVNAILKQNCQPSESLRQLEQFVRTSTFIDPTIESKIKALSSGAPMGQEIPTPDFGLLTPDYFSLSL